MTKIQLSKRNLLAILAGIVIIVLIGIIINSLTFLLNLHLMRTFSAFNQQPYLTFTWLLKIISFFSPLIGGFIVGLLIKEKGWLYGGILGVTLMLISISIALLLQATFINNPQLSPQQGQNVSQQNILSQLLNSPLKTIILTALGGYLGEKFHKKNRKKK